MQSVARPEMWRIADSEQIITTPVQSWMMNREQKNIKVSQTSLFGLVSLFQTHLNWNRVN